MSAFINNTVNSNTVGTAGTRADRETLFREIHRFVPELSPPNNPDSVALTIDPALDLKPAYSESPSTLALVLRYFRYNVYAPLFYLTLAKYCVDNDDDGTKSMTMVAPELADGSPFRYMSAAELLEEIHKGRELLLEGLREREKELEEELKSVEKWKRLWSEVDSVLSVLLAIINSGALVAAKVMPASVTALLLASLGAGNLLITSTMKVVDWWLGVTDDELKSQLESQKDGIKVMRRELLLLDLKPIRSLLENLKIKRIALRAVEIERNSTAPTEEAGQTQAADHLELEVNMKEMKKTVNKGMKDVRKMVERVEREVKKAAVDFAHIITQ